MSLLKLNRTKTLDSQVTLVRPSGVLLPDHSIVAGHRFKLSQFSVASLALRASLAVALCGSLLTLTAHAADKVQVSSDNSDEYIYSERQVPQAALSSQETVNIDKISQNLEKGSYQPIPLQSIIDPTTGVPIDDVYRIDVPEQLSLLQAQNVLVQVSPKLASKNATRYRVDADVDLMGLKTGINDSVEEALQNNTLPPLPPEVGEDISNAITGRLPDEYNLKREGSNTTLEKQADALLDKDQLQTTLVERYFTAQLAMLAAYLREDALNTVRETNHMAQRYLEEGFISGVDR